MVIVFFFKWVVKGKCRSEKCHISQNSYVSNESNFPFSSEVSVFTTNVVNSDMLI